MKTLTKIACRTVGTIGIGASLYNAMRVGNQFSRNESQRIQAKYLENVYFDSRTTDSVDYIDNQLRQKTFDLRSRNPIPSVWGKVKGWTQGSLYGLGNNLFTVACASLALISKGFWAKAGAIGVALSACYSIARNGFGLGKHHPMN